MRCLDLCLGVLLCSLTCFISRFSKIYLEDSEIKCDMVEQISKLVEALAYYYTEFEVHRKVVTQKKSRQTFTCQR